MRPRDDDFICAGIDVGIYRFPDAAASRRSEGKEYYETGPIPWI